MTEPSRPPRQGFLNVVHDADLTNNVFNLKPLRIAAPNAIPHRQWVYGSHIIRGYVTLLVAPGGSGKSSLVLAICMSIAIGRSLLGPRIHRPCNTALLNLEDPQDEIDRRVTALSMRYDLSETDVAGRFFTSPPDQSITIASIGEDGFSVVHPDEKIIIERVKDEKIGVLAVDPFAESHTLEENSNPHMVQAAAAWRRVARFGQCAVVLTHHVRKGLVNSIEAARGAKALSDSARIGLLLSTMTEEEASSLDISSDDRLQYARLDDAKANLAPRAPKASWFRLNHVTLENADEIYPHGDQVVVIEAWKPPSAFDQLSVVDLNAALDHIDAGLPGGVRYSHTRQSAERWAGTVLMEILGVPEGQAETIVKTWLKSGLLLKEAYHDAVQRKPRTGLRVNNARRPGAS